MGGCEHTTEARDIDPQYNSIHSILRKIYDEYEQGKGTAGPSYLEGSVRLGLASMMRCNEFTVPISHGVQILIWLKAFKTSSWSLYMGAELVGALQALLKQKDAELEDRGKLLYKTKVGVVTAKFYTQIYFL
jgi:hypothetical protein